MSKMKWTTVAVGLAVMIVATSCSSSKLSSSTSGGTGKTYTIGLLTDVTGPGSVTGASTPKGVAAGIGLASQEGYKIKYVVADTGSSPSGALTAAQTLVEQDHVFAVIAISGLTFSASNYLTSQNIPVVGAAIDASEWITSKNMFSVIGTQNFTKVQSTYGLVFKNLGVTKLGTIGYSISPSSAEAAAGAAISAEAAGLKAPYVNTSFPLGSTNVTPIALAMKTAGVDGVTASIETNSSFALITALRQEGVNLKVALLPTGYGGDLTGGGPGSEQAAQGVYFSTGFEPVEMQTAATQRFVNSLKTHAGVETDPTLGEYLGYMSVNAFVTGLNAAGSDPTQATFIKAMLGITNYNGTGLYGSHSVGFTMSQRGLAAGADNCLWITRYSGSSFHLIAGMDPICGTVFPGKTVSS